jgi:molybdopterin-containing oxidoreductase family iron-sulfur binding subunit
MNSRKHLEAKLSALQLPAHDKKVYWQSLEELADEPSFQELMKQEFPALADVWPDALSRRRFLALMGASLALAGIGGCSVKPAPQGTIVPYVRQPAELTPGVPLFFATTMIHGQDATGLLVESHEGRPTKIEGNPEHPASRGATSIYHQASILGLYDPARSQTVMQGTQVRDWDDAERVLRKALLVHGRRQGSGLCLLTEPLRSPTLIELMERLLNRFPQARWRQYQPIYPQGLQQAHQWAFGKAVQPVYDFTKAEVVLSIDCDFLASGPGHLRYARDFMSRRRVSGNPGQASDASMNRLYALEPSVSCTGAKADHRLAATMTDIERLAWALAAALGVVSSAPAMEPSQQSWIAAVAEDLRQHGRASVVVAGHRQSAAVHLLVHAINAQLNGFENVLTFVRPPTAQPADNLQSLQSLANEIDDGEVETLVILGGNPALTAPADVGLADRLAKVPLSFRLGLYEDETSRCCHWHLPEAHYLEAWGDARAFDGTASIVQPLIEPLYQGRSALQVVAALLGDKSADGLQLVRDHWQRQWDGVSAAEFETKWRTALHEGVIAESAAPAIDVALKADWQRHLQRPGDRAPERHSETLELIFQEDPTLDDGSFATNGWLQELPKPLTKLTWENAALMSPTTAVELGVAAHELSHGGEHGGYLVPRLRLSLDGKQVEAPVWIVPGHADHAITVYLGHGRTAAARVSGQWQQTLGFNAYPLRTIERPWFARGLSVERIESVKKYPLASTQARHVFDDRNVIRSGTLGEYRQDPRQVVTTKHEHEQETFPRVDLPVTQLPSLNDPAARRWGMSIDITACVGCSACVVACQAENNIPVVGKEQVLMGREMHWLRVDRYHTGEPEAPAAFYFQPLPCMHCEHAPCEYVCPVAATVHSADGLNDMIYNRCVGTRFCSNNCPYKVRRFNFLAYSDFETPSRRQQYNPDVTVRSRGVMEKCTYCVQRIRHAEVSVEAAGRPLADGKVLTACQAACPTQAIVFGDLNDADSQVAKAKASPLKYELLGELNTFPRTTYLAALRNPNPALEPD